MFKQSHADKKQYWYWKMICRNIYLGFIGTIKWNLQSIKVTVLLHISLYNFEASPVLVEMFVFVRAWLKVDTMNNEFWAQLSCCVLCNLLIKPWFVSITLIDYSGESWKRAKIILIKMSRNVLKDNKKY